MEWYFHNIKTMNWRERFNKLRVGDRVKISSGTHFYHDQNIYNGDTTSNRSSARTIKIIDGEWVQLNGDHSYWFLLKDMVKQ